MGGERRSRIVHVVNTLSGGGMERVLLKLLGRSDRTHFGHAVVTLRGGGELCRVLPADVPLCVLGARGAARMNFVGLRRVLRVWKPALVHARGAGCWFDAAAAAALCRLPVMLGFHGLETGEDFTNNQRRAARWGRRWGAVFTSVSRAGVELMKDRLRLPPEAIQHLPNGVDTLRFAPPQGQERVRARAALGIPRAAVVIGTIASLSPIKRHDLMIEMLAEMSRRIRDVYLLVVGEGPLRAQLAERARQRGVEERVLFTGPREGVVGAYHSLDVYVCASDAEGVSNSLLEAMACGVPVVTTNVGDHGIIVRDGVEGVVVPPGSVSGLCRAMRRVLALPTERARMGAAARLRAAPMNLDSMLAAYQRLYERLVVTDRRPATEFALAG